MTDFYVDLVPAAQEVSKHLAEVIAKLDPEAWIRRGMIDIETAFAAAVRERRTEIGLSQEELGREIGTHQQTIARIELGQRSVSLAEAVRLVDALDMRDALIDLIA